MVEKQQTSHAQSPPEDAEPDGAGPKRSHKATIVVVGCLVALAVVGALLAQDRGGSRDAGEGTRTATTDVDPGETPDADTPAGDDTDDADDAGGDDVATERRDPAAPEAGTGSAQPDASGLGEPESPNLDMALADFRDRWNTAVGAIGRGYPLEEHAVEDFPEEDSSGAIAEYPVQQSMDAFGFIEVRIRPDGLVSSAVVEGEPAGAQQEEEYFATLAAAVAAATGLSGPEAVDLLASDLGIDGTADAQDHVAGTEVDGVLIEIEAASGLWSLYVGGPWTS